MAFSETNLKWNYLESLKTWVPMIFSGAIQLAGVPSPVAEILKEVLAGFLEGTSIKDEESYQQFQASWQTGLPGLLEEHKDQLAPYLVEMLKIVFEPKAYLEILSTKDPEAALEQAMRLACLRDKSASLWKLGKDNIQNMVKEIISASMNQIEGDPVFLQAVQDKQWFARHFRTNPHTANADYALSFAAPLFLHKGSPDGWRVSLRNLYVMPKYKEVYIKDDLEARLTSFIRGDIPFLLIEGDAGTGKTTLAAWLNYHYVLGDKPKLFADRPLVTVRLRDLDGQSVTAGKTFTGAVLDYLQLEGNINRLPPNAVLLLDGFDELCMIEKATVQQEEFFMPLYRAAKRKGFKVILTSRPTAFSCDIPKKERYLRIALQHFDETKRKEWCDLYTGPCGQTLDKKVGDYIAQIDDKDDNKVSCVCDTPMTLYMLAAGNETENYLNNDWALYRHIFMDALSETDYNEMQSDKECDLQHGIHPYRELLYRISENIAFEMFQMGNTAFSLTEKPIQKIIADLKLEKNANETDQDCQKLTESTEAILEKCYGLCCYWKTGGQKGAVEFLHNTIRDFFLAEYFCRRLDAMAWAMNKSGENKIEQLTDLLARLLWYAELEPNVLYFAYQRALYNKQEGTRDYASWEASHHKIKDILDDLSDKGILRNAAKFCEEEKAKSDKVNLHWCTLNIVKNTIMLYRVAYEPHLKKDMYICWCDWTRGKNDLVYALFAEIFGNDPFCCFNEGHSAKCGVMPFGLGSRAVFTGPYKAKHPVFYKKNERKACRADGRDGSGRNESVVRQFAGKQPALVAFA